MICKRCNGKIPTIDGIKYCPFCNKKLSEAEESMKYFQYSREHHILCKNISIYAQNLETLVSAIVKRQLGIPSKKRIHLCEDENAIELWHKLCMTMINALEDELKML